MAYWPLLPQQLQLTWSLKRKKQWYKVKSLLNHFKMPRKKGVRAEFHFNMATDPLNPHLLRNQLKCAGKNHNFIYSRKGWKLPTCPRIKKVHQNNAILGRQESKYAITNAHKNTALKYYWGKNSSKPVIFNSIFGIKATYVISTQNLYAQTKKG